jgi:hypothetical protein
MLIVKKELDLYDFMNEYEDILPEDYSACEIIFDNLEEYQDMDDMTIRDYIRFEVYISTKGELLYDYDIIDDDEIEDLDDDEIEERIEEYLGYNTHLLGYYKDNNGETVYIYDEF